jgi:acyl carrier protein
MVNQSPKIKIVEFDATAARRHAMRSQAESRAPQVSPQVQNVPPPAPDNKLDNAALKSFLIEFVVEQTGYPEEIVELDADLEGDLGIDSIKKAQLFGELNERFEIQVRSNMSLDDFPTLRHVMDYLLHYGRERGSVSPPPTTPKPIVASKTVSPSVASASKLDETKLKSFLIEFVVEQTGYPEEIVELDADLEGDLGIDSIKKAHLFGELNERFEIQVQSNISLDDFPTLRHVMDYLLQHGQERGSASKAAQPATASVTAPSPPQGVRLDETKLKSFLIGFVVEQTGYPEEIVELDADLEGDLGIDSIKKAQLFGELNERFEVKVQDNMSLDDFPTLRHVMDYLLIHARQR